MEVVRRDLLRRAPAACRGAVRQADRVLQGRAERRGDRGPARPGRAPGRPPGLRGPAPAASEGQLPADRAAVRPRDACAARVRPVGGPLGAPRAEHAGRRARERGAGRGATGLRPAPDGYAGTMTTLEVPAPPEPDQPNPN